MYGAKLRAQSLKLAMPVGPTAVLRISKKTNVNAALLADKFVKIVNLFSNRLQTQIVCIFDEIISVCHNRL